MKKLLNAFRAVVAFIQRKKPEQMLTAVYFYNGEEFYREVYPLKRLLADGESFIKEDINVMALRSEKSVMVLKSEIVGNEYHIHCSRRFV